MKKYKGAIIMLGVQLVIANLTALLVSFLTNNVYVVATVVSLIVALMYVTMFGHAIRKS